MGAIIGTIGALMGRKRSREKAEVRQASARLGMQQQVQRQTNVAEDERLRRLRLLQGDVATQEQMTTGRKKLLGQ